MTNLDLVKQLYSDFAKGNVEGVIAQFDPAIEWHECKLGSEPGFVINPDKSMQFLHKQ